MTLYILATVFLSLTGLVAWRHGRDGVLRGLRTSWQMLSLVAPIILVGLAVAGMTRVILPADLISQWMGEESGITGILIGTAAGALIPGGPWLVMPITASVMAAGAGVGAVAAFITAWGLIPLTRTLAWEWPFLGGSFTAARMVVALPFPLLAGYLTPPVFNLMD